MRKSLHVITVGLIILTACGLYLPFLENPFIFDDWVLFGGNAFAYFATWPFDYLHTRNLPNFSLAVTYILGSGMATQRTVSLVLHIASALALYKLTFDLLRVAAQPDQAGRATDERQTAYWALAAAAAFAIHPVTVYGAGYLVQRSIVLATLFSLLSVLLLVRGLRRGAYSDAVAAALLYTLAVYSKEHCILLPAVAALAVFLVAADRRFGMRYGLVYLAACAPAAIMVAMLSLRVIGGSYEPDYVAVADQLEGVFGLEAANMSLARSAVAQAGLFYKYLFLWIWPDVRTMSIDLRVDFSLHWSAGWILLNIVAFAMFGVVAGFLLWCRGRPGLIGFGMLFVWILFLVEFSAARFQEPFVLYRFYLWAPGIVIAMVAVLRLIPGRAALALFFLVLPLLFFQARDRLVTFSHPFLLWQDAAAKLPAQPVPWGSRALYSLAREYIYAGNSGKAMEYAERCMAQYPDTYHCYFAKGAILAGQGELGLALPFLQRAVALKPKSEIAHQRLAWTLEKLGRIEEAMAALRNASALGFSGADKEIKRLNAERQNPPREQ